jgi:trehalose 6-phosphate synthase
VRVYPIAIDAVALAAEAATPRVKARIERFRQESGERKLIVRVDRTELTKNIQRGFLGFECFLLRYPEWRGRVRFLALLNPSRPSVPEYRAYTDECLRTAERINDELGEEGWQPIDVRVQDDFDDAVAAYVLYDVLLVNPTFDGMNLVAKEGPAVNRRRGVLVLSRNTGAHQELRRHAIPVNPFDLEETAEAIHTALEMPQDERARRSAGLRSAVRRNDPERWVAAQLADLATQPGRSVRGAR